MVDDEKYSLLALKESLKEYGIEKDCVFTESYQDAIDEANRENFDYALLDIEMPEGNGLSLAEELVILNPSIRIAFVTAFNNYAAEAFEVNAVDYILKPVRGDRFRKGMDRLFMKEQRETPGDSKNPLPASTTNTCASRRMKANFFWKFDVRVDGQEMKWKRTKSMELFAYMLENENHYLYKDQLCEIMWPEMDPKKALINLQTAIYQLRRTMEEFCFHEATIEYARNSYRLVTNEVCVDVYSFDRYLKDAEEHPEESILYLTKAVELYKGGYLASEGWEWARQKETIYERKYLAALEKLASKLVMTEAYGKAVTFLEILLLLNPWNENGGALYRTAAEKIFGKEEAEKKYEILISEEN